jgi:long-chain acyl-CoA synthetase
MEHVGEFLQSLCLKYEDKICIIDESESEISYTDFYNTIIAAQSYFAAYKLPKHFRFSIVKSNSLEYLTGLFALQNLGGIAVNLNPNLTNSEIEERLNLVEVDVLLCSETLFEEHKEMLTNSELRFVFTNKEGLDYLSYSALELHTEKRKSMPILENTLFLQFTGGTTGLTKAAVITHQNVLANIEQLDVHMAQYIELKDLRVLVAFPFYHIFSLVFNLLFFMRQGGTCVLYKDLRDTKKITHLFKKHQPNFTVGVNTWYKKLMQSPEFRTLDFSNIRASLAGAEYVPLKTKEDWRALTGKPLFSAYGLTETCSLAIVSPLNDQENEEDSIGIPIPQTEVRLLSEYNNWIEEDDVPGEIVLKGPQLTSGYFSNEEETKAAFFEGWLKTGDIAVRKKGVFYKIVDRKKDMINVSGNKVYPNEVEEALLRIPGVLDVAIVGQHSTRSGEHVVACIVKEEEIELDESVLIAHCRKHLSAFKVPKAIYWYKALPKTPIGKTARNILRKDVNLHS